MVSLLCRFYIWVFRGTPLLMQLFVVSMEFLKLGLLLCPSPLQ